MALDGADAAAPKRVDTADIVRDGDFSSTKIRFLSSELPTIRPESRLRFPATLRAALRFARAGAEHKPAQARHCLSKPRGIMTVYLVI
jgi:hypothetical protein